MKISAPLTARSLLVLAAVGLVPLATVTVPAQAATSTCAVSWGSLAKSSPTMVRGPITDVRAGRHACFDRLVLDVSGLAPGYSVAYVDAVRTEGQGAVVPLRGGARLAVVTRAPAYGSGGTPGYTPRNARELAPVAGYATFRQIAWAGSFEGQTTVGLGVRARLPFRAFVIQDAGASRLVIDVAHHW